MDKLLEIGVVLYKMWSCKIIVIWRNFVNIVFCCCFLLFVDMLVFWFLVVGKLFGVSSCSINNCLVSVYVFRRVFNFFKRVYRFGELKVNLERKGNLVGCDF